MTHESFLAGTQWLPVRPGTQYRGTPAPTHFNDPSAEYQAATHACAVLDFAHRGLVRVTGRDRATWLHNLVTNAVKTLEVGRGTYAFACDVQGRIQFDLNILALHDQLLLDLDRSVVDLALRHFDRLLITEDAKLENLSSEFERVACAGPQAPDFAIKLWNIDLTTMPPLSHVELPGGGLLVRSFFAGPQPISFELILPRTAALACWEQLVNLGALPAGTTVLEALRIEAGLPVIGPDMDKALPAATGQLQRAVSFHKGCYLGQEVIERMRSRGSLARRLVRLGVEQADALTVPSQLLQAGSDAGQLTSVVRHPVSGQWIGLGYLRTSVRDTAGITTGSPPRQVQILD